MLLHEPEGVGSSTKGLQREQLIRIIGYKEVCLRRRSSWEM